MGTRCLELLTPTKYAVPFQALLPHRCASLYPLLQETLGCIFFDFPQEVIGVLLTFINILPDKDTNFQNS